MKSSALLHLGLILLFYSRGSRVHDGQCTVGPPTLKGRKNFLPKPFSWRKDVLNLSRQLTYYILQMVRYFLSPHFNISEITISVMSYLIGSISSFLTLLKVSGSSYNGWHLRVSEIWAGWRHVKVKRRVVIIADKSNSRRDCLDQGENAKDQNLNTKGGIRRLTPWTLSWFCSQWTSASVTDSDELPEGNCSTQEPLFPV